jgi:hypothetical protein
LRACREDDMADIIDRTKTYRLIRAFAPTIRSAAIC